MGRLPCDACLDVGRLAYEEPAGARNYAGA